MEWKKDTGGNFDDDDSVSWNPEGPDELVGVLESKKTVNTKHGPTVLLKVRDEAGQLFAIWCNRTSLKNLVAENDEELIVGRTVGFRTEGKTTLDNGNTFFSYEVGFGDSLVSVGAGTSNRVTAEESF